MPDTIPELDYGGKGPELAFLHANAYPPECYRPLLQAFARDFHVRAMLQRPLWKDAAAASLDSWHPLSSDFLAWLQQRAAPRIVAVGHSMGAIVALRAAMQAPARFGALVLLDPVLLTRRRMLIWRLMRRFALGHRLHSVIRRAERRRNVFRDMNEAFAAYRRHAVFRWLGNAELRQAIRGMLEPVDGHLELHFKPTWEARLYFTAVWNDGDLWKRFPALSVPTMIIRGAESDTFTEAASSAVRDANSRIQVQTIRQASHLVPLEQPGEVHALATKFMQRALGSDPSGS